MDAHPPQTGKHSEVFLLLTIVTWIVSLCECNYNMSYETTCINMTLVMFCMYFNALHAAGWHSKVFLRCWIFLILKVVWGLWKATLFYFWSERRPFFFRPLSSPFIFVPVWKSSFKNEKLLSSNLYSAKTKWKKHYNRISHMCPGGWCYSTGKSLIILWMALHSLCKSVSFGGKKSSVRYKSGVL